MALLDSLCVASSLQLSTNVAAPLTLEYHLYDHLSTQWLKKPSQKQPYIKLLISLAHLDYPRLGYNSQIPTPTVHILAMADTRC